MTVVAALLPCPFCGGEARACSWPCGDLIGGHYEYWQAQVRCVRCRAGSREDAFDAPTQGAALDIARESWNWRWAP